MGYIFYNIILFITFPIIILFIIITRFRRLTGAVLKSIPQRLGKLPFWIGELSNKDVVWIHCSSLGEAKLAVTLIDELKKERSSTCFILSVITESAFNWTKGQEKMNYIFFLPADFPFIIRHYFKAIKPKALIILETELWPNLIKIAKEFGVKVGLVNGRLSDKNFKLLMKLRFIAKKILLNFDFLLSRSEEDSRRLIALGAAEKNISCAGNMKYDIFNLPSFSDDKLHSRFGLNSKDLIFTAGSVRRGEEQIIIGSYLANRSVFPNLKMIIAPRHLERVEAVKRILDKHSISYTSHSAIDNASKSEGVVILDTYGELMKAYAIADLCFIGGSLVDYGGQNIIEPAMMGKAIITGPFMSNFSESFELLKSRGSIITVLNQHELSSAIKELLSDKGRISKLGDDAKSAVISQKGALKRSVKEILQYI
ncbi:MAG: glycosyltransferase N-terminal domain-containing protein [bacterium]